MEGDEVQIITQNDENIDMNHSEQLDIDDDSENITNENTFDDPFKIGDMFILITEEDEYKEDALVTIEEINKEQKKLYLKDENENDFFLSLDDNNNIILKTSDYSIFEIQMVFGNSMLLMLDGGLRWVDRLAGDSYVFDGYRVLDPGVQSQGGYLRAMSNAVDNIWRNLTTGDPLNSDVDTALITQILCENILGSCRR